MFGWLRGKRAAPAVSIEREYNTDIVGIEHVQGGVDLVRELRIGDQVSLVREPDNPHDGNAMAVLTSAGHKIGYIPARIAADLARALERDSGKITNATVVEKTALGRDRKRFSAVVCFHLTRLRRDR